MNFSIYLSLFCLASLFCTFTTESSIIVNTENLPINSPQIFNAKSSITFKIPSEATSLYISSCIGIMNSYLSENQIPSTSSYSEKRSGRQVHYFQMEQESPQRQRTYYALVEPLQVAQSPVTFQILASTANVPQREDMRPVALSDQQRGSIEGSLIEEGSVVIRWRPATEVKVLSSGNDKWHSWRTPLQGIADWIRGFGGVGEWSTHQISSTPTATELHFPTTNTSENPLSAQNSLQYAIYAVDPKKASSTCNYATVCGIEAQNCAAQSLLDWGIPSTRTSNGLFEQEIHTVPVGQEKEWIYVVMVRTDNKQRHNIYDPYEFPTNNWLMQLLTVICVIMVAVVVMVCVCGITFTGLLVIRHRTNKRRGYLPPTNVTY